MKYGVIVRELSLLSDSELSEFIRCIIILHCVGNDKIEDQILVLKYQAFIQEL